MSPRARLVVPLAGLVVALALIAAGACTESDAAAGGGASAGGAGPSASSASSSSGSSSASSATSGGAPDAGPCQPWPIPGNVPAGWLEYTDWSCDCRFYVAGSKDVLPEAIKWEKCPASLASVDCRMMVTDWTDDPNPIASFPRFDVLPDGKGLLLFTRVGADFLYELVAEVDGPVRTAILQVGKHLHQPDPGCYMFGEDLDDGYFVFSLNGHDQSGKESESAHTGAIADHIDELHPKVLAHYTGAGDDSWLVSSNWVVRITDLDHGFKVYASPWSMEHEIFITSPAVDPQGMKLAQPVLIGDAFFWNTHALYQGGGINVWTPEGGARPFIRWIEDPSREAGDLGTDGVDIVWAYGEGREPDEKWCPVRSIMTAKFTTDPDKLEPRRVRSHPVEIIGLDNFVVGCGYAAHQGCCNDTLVVRLSDGVSWVLGTYPDPMLDYPIGLTCDEVFVRGDIEGRNAIARIRLDSLGPGMAPD